MSAVTRRVVIVGGVAGGMSAATRLRRNDEHAAITVFERGGHVSFANCGLPYHVGGVVEDREELLLQSPESLKSRFNLDVRIRHEVTAVNPDAGTVTVRDLTTGGEFEQGFDALVLATGAAPYRPELPGIERAHSLRDVADLDAIMADLAVLESRAAKNTGARKTPRVAILGGGFIGLELAENLVLRGMGVTLLQSGPRILAPLDPEMVTPVVERLEANGVTVLTRAVTRGIEHDAVVLADGTRIAADLVVTATGVRPESGLARAAGLSVGTTGGVVVDASQRTSNPRIYAVGDAAEKRDAISGGAVLVPLAQTANRHGRLVADVITGRTVRAAEVLGTAVVGVFGLTAAMSGWNEQRLRAAGRAYRAIHSHPANHAGYYPGATGMSLKLLVDPENDKILGVQGVGGQGVDKRIDVIATAMRAGITASELADLELAYAPQFGSAKDPVNMLGMIADNLAAGNLSTLQWHELDDAVAAGAQIVDVRSAAEFDAGAIPGAINVSVDELRTRHGELPDAPLVVHCAVGQRGNTAARILTQLGFTAQNLDGGYLTWKRGIHSAEVMANGSVRSAIPVPVGS
ncbi:FAD-dependent oxidoreductase [Arthrobacter sp. SDTb3-6]|uniref:FAD-dependent oxidoreductase n=1 Tax=Arthrobacter sp. SDTb3-6 TaxID=2713571 RepID=UPI00159DB598|nr:FAD-dependent oxidoreductase [Arthrobacter sp. SDTb3-6]NVN00512.1 FAD-dependent oxidoreductase [Arthrobacter sp. SDTb3-6]